MAYLDDIKGNHYTCTPLIEITTLVPVTTTQGVCVYNGTEFPEVQEEACLSGGGEWVTTESVETSELIYRISNKKIRFDSNYYRPILDSVPVVSESIDVINSKYKISSLKLQIVDYIEDGERFSDNLGNLINQDLRIWFHFPSCNSLDDCYFIGLFTIRSFSQNHDKITLNCEDLSEEKLHRDVPISTVPSNEEVPEIYRGKPYPITFGLVENSPCVITRDTSEMFPENENYGGNFDIKYSKQYDVSSLHGDNPIKAYVDDNYISILKDLELEVLDSSNIIEPEQYEEVEGGITLLFKSDTIVKGYLQGKFIGHPTGITAEDNKAWGNYPNIPATFETSDEYGIITEGFNAIKDNGLSANYKQNFDASFGPDGFPATMGINLPEIFPAGEKIKYKLIHNFIFNYTSLLGGQTKWGLGIGDGFELISGNSYTYFLWGVSEIHDYGNNGVGEWERIITKDGQQVWPDGETGIKKLPFPAQKIKYLQSNPPGAPGAYDGMEITDLDINLLQLEITYSFDRIFSKKYYASILGRGGLIPNYQETLNEILLEIGSDGITLGVFNDIELGSYSFALNEKINSKKLIEDLSKSSAFYPYHKNGEFFIKSIKSEYNNYDVLISSKDVMKYSFSKTDLENVYTRVKVKYNFDHEHKETINETDWVYPEDLASIDGYDSNYFKVGFDQELVFESDYISSESTARNLAKYLTGFYANQHNIIKLVLPLKYLDISIGDIVKFDELIQGRKLLGEDYVNNISRNGQIIYPYFFVNKIKKNLSEVHVDLYQLHSFSFDSSVVLGCTDEQADNYNDAATLDDGT